MEIGVQSVALQHPRKPPRFQGINLIIETGEFVLIPGASGVGKSSLLRLLNCLQETSGGGGKRFDGRIIADYEVTTLRRRVGYIQQTPVMLPGSVEDTLDLPFHFRS